MVFALTGIKRVGFAKIELCRCAFEIFNACEEFLHEILVRGKAIEINDDSFSLEFLSIQRR